jgi:hypothetical protein
VVESLKGAQPRRFFYLWRGRAIRDRYKTLERPLSMKWAGTKNLGMLLLSIWLIATGLLSFVQVNFVHMGLVMAALAIAAGVLLLLGR